VVGILAWRSVAGPPRERLAARWFALTLAWSALALAVGAATLATVVPGLPNDHYHAFLDPLVFVTLGLGAAASWQTRRAALRLAAAAGVAAVVAFNVTIWPAPVASDGGWPAARAAAARIGARVGGADYPLVAIPEFKSGDAYAFPLVQSGHPPSRLVDAGPIGGLPLVIVCDRLFEETVGSRCGGPAEDALASRLDAPPLTDRFDASARTAVSVYLPR
jgi:hypothetical protein